MSLVNILMNKHWQMNLYTTVEIRRLHWPDSQYKDSHINMYCCRCSDGALTPMNSKKDFIGDPNKTSDKPKWVFNINLSKIHGTHKISINHTISHCILHSEMPAASTALNRLTN